MGASGPYQVLRNPAHVLGACLKVIGEAFMQTEMKESTDWVVASSPFSPEFIADVSRSPTIFAPTFNHYLERAASYDYATSNALAHAASATDKPLAFAVTDEQAFWLLAAIVRGADFDSPSSVEKASSIAKGQINSLLTERHAGFGRKVVQHEFDVLIRDMPVENEAVLVNSMPEPMLLAADRDDDLVNVPSIATNRSPAAAAIGEFPPEFVS